MAEMKIKPVTVSQLREKLPDILSEVDVEKQEYVVMKNGRPYVRILPISSTG
jgi:prevent-host-death family protein